MGICASSNDRKIMKAEHGRQIPRNLKRKLRSVISLDMQYVGYSRNYTCHTGSPLVQGEVNCKVAMLVDKANGLFGAYA